VLIWKIVLRAHPTNISAKTLAEKCRFELEGIIRKDDKTSSKKIINLVYYRKLNKYYYQHLIKLMLSLVLSKISYGVSLENHYTQIRNFPYAQTLLII
jgi:hypothetical protein